MKELLPVFPLAAVFDTGASLDSAMDRFLETEERGDLKILGRAYVSYPCLLRPLHLTMVLDIRLP